MRGVEKGAFLKKGIFRDGSKILWTLSRFMVMSSFQLSVKTWTDGGNYRPRVARDGYNY